MLKKIFMMSLPFMFIACGMEYDGELADYSAMQDEAGIERVADYGLSDERAYGKEDVSRESFDNEDERNPPEGNYCGGQIKCCNDITCATLLCKPKGHEDQTQCTATCPNGLQLQDYGCTSIGPDEF